MKKNTIIAIILACLYFIYINIDDSIECDLLCFFKVFNQIDDTLGDQINDDLT